MKKITIIGMGKMGTALYDRLLKQTNFVVSGCGKKDDFAGKVLESDIIILAVKPQDFGDLSQSVGADFSGKLIISIMAGVNLETIERGFDVQKVIRSMPNLGASIGEGVTGWIANAGCDEEDKDVAKNIFSAIGHQFEFEDEHLLDKIGAISGSGPAYFFYLTKLLEEKAIEFGFSRTQAERLAIYTFLSAAKVMEHSKKNAKDLVDAVASRGGITESAFLYMKEHRFDEIFKQAVEEAKKRSEELG
ncbi:MAG: pyrroline-5-carboxylate reductase [Candidatus Magasanikbacteria bacterium]|nr:pyrroline-5-carboxylate reductase [Candidatus Magasanikbacteria bacterium]